MEKKQECTVLTIKDFRRAVESLRKNEREE